MAQPGVAASTDPPGSPMTKMYTRTEIEALADELRGMFDVVDAAGCVDVDQIVLELGGSIEVLFETLDRPESLQVRAPDDFTVILPWNTSTTRDRFTVAHELGHLKLHYREGGDNLAFYRYGDDRREIEANAFASALLMPAAAFTAAWEAVGKSASALADQFGVSKSAVRVRAEVLGLS